MESDNLGPAYWIWGIDNVAYGPVELPGLINWIKQERVTGDTWVFLQTTNGWRKASELPELKICFKVKADTAIITRDQKAQTAARNPGISTGVLRRIKIFGDLEEKQLESFLQYMETLKFRQFTQVVRKGDHGDAMFLVLEGELRSSIMIDGKESILSTITTGEFFGEISLLDQGPRSADVYANLDSVVLKISAASFGKLIREAPALATPFLFALSRSVVGHVRGLTKKYQDSVRFLRAAGSAQ